MGFETNVGKAVEFYNKRLNKITKKGIPMAVASTLDNMAYQSRIIATKIFESKFVIRGKWTQRGMLFQKTKKTVPIDKMEARSGNIRDYAADLEEGATIRAKNTFIPIPALGSRIGKSIKKRIASRFAINKVQARRMPKIAGRPSRRFAAMLNIARKEKYFGPFLVTDAEAGSDRIPRGIFNLTGRGRGKRRGGTITMLRKLQKTVTIHGRTFIKPAGEKIGKQMDKIYIKEAKRKLEQFRLGKDIK